MGDAGSFICENMSLHQPAADRGANINSSSCTRQISFLLVFPNGFSVLCVKRTLTVLRTSQIFCCGILSVRWNGNAQK
jgi:hypothetical protein